MSSPHERYPELTKQGEAFMLELDNRLAGPASQTTRPNVFRTMRLWCLTMEAAVAELQVESRERAVKEPGE